MKPTLDKRQEAESSWGGTGTSYVQFIGAVPYSFGEGAGFSWTILSPVFLYMHLPSIGTATEGEEVPNDPGDGTISRKSWLWVIKQPWRKDCSNVPAGRTHKNLPASNTLFLVMVSKADFALLDLQIFQSCHLRVSTLGPQFCAILKSVVDYDNTSNPIKVNQDSSHT